MKLRAGLTALLTGLAACTTALAAPDALTVNKIADQSFNHSQVMQTAAYLTDQIGGRLTNGPGARKAEAWTQAKFKKWGLSNVRAEGFEFGRGWAIEDSSVKMTAPRPLVLRSIPMYFLIFRSAAVKILAGLTSSSTRPICRASSGLNSFPSSKLREAFAWPSQKAYRLNMLLGTMMPTGTSFRPIMYLPSAMIL